MSKSNSKKIKYYAIKEGKGVSNVIVTTWAECSKLVLGYNAVYKSFTSIEDANEYLGKISVGKVREQTNKAIEHKKKVKGTTKAIKGFRVNNEVYDLFIAKCEEFETTPEKVLEGMIKEWVDFE